MPAGHVEGFSNVGRKDERAVAMISDAWYVGVTLCLVSNVLSPVGYVLQKRSSQRRPVSDAKERAAAGPRTAERARLPYQWLAGCCLVLVSIVLSLLSSAFTAQSLLAPLSSSALIMNMAASALLLGEKVTRLNLLSAALIVVGSVLSVVFGDHSDSVYTNGGLISSFHTVGSVLYACLTSALCLLIYATLRCQPAFAAALPEGRKQRKRDMLQALLYCVLAGAAGAQCDLFGKMVVELASTSIQGDQQLLSVYPYLYFAAMLAFTAIQIHFLSHGLVLSDALYCLPLYECVEILTSTVGAAILFGELDGYSLKQLLAFVLGLLSLLAGVAVMTLRDYNVPGVGSGSNSSTVRSARQSVHNTATMLAQLNVRLWKVTRVRDEEDDEEEEGTVGKARSMRSRSQSEVELLHSFSRAQRERRLMGTVGAKAVSLQSTGQLRLSQEVELSVLKLTQQLSPVSSSFRRDSPSAVRAMASLSRSSSMPTYFFASVADQSELPSRSPSQLVSRLALSPSSDDRSTSDRWAHLPSSNSVSLLSPSSQRRAAVSREEVSPRPMQARERQLSVLAEESLDTVEPFLPNSLVELPQPPVEPTVSTQMSSPSSPPLLRVVRVARVVPSDGRHRVSRSIGAVTETERQSAATRETVSYQSSGTRTARADLYNIHRLQ